jgi:hypothetical protein
MDVSTIGLSTDDYDGKPLSIFQMVAIVRNYINAFVYTWLLDNNQPKIQIHEIISWTIK